MFHVPQRAKLIASCLLFVTILALTTFRTIRVYHVPVAKDTIQFGLCDFHNAVYFPGLAFARGENPYSAAYAAKYPVNREMSPYSPFLLPFASLMGLLPLRLSEYVWYSTNAFLIFALSGALMYIARIRITATRVLLVASLILATRAGQSNQILGQFGIFFCLFTLVAIRTARTDRFLSAMGIALAALKPTFGIPLILMLVSGKKIQPVVLGVLVTTLGAGLSIGWILLHHPTNLLASFENSHDAIVHDEDVDPSSAWMRTDLISVIARNLSITPDLRSELLGMLVVLLPSCLALWRLSSSRNTEETRALEQAVVLSAIPICIYHLSYDLLVVLPALALALSGRVFTTQKYPMLYRTIYVALLTIPLLNYFAAYSVMEKLQISGTLREVAISLNPVLLLAANIVLWLAVNGHKRFELKHPQLSVSFDSGHPEVSKNTNSEKAGVTAGA